MDVLREEAFPRGSLPQGVSLEEITVLLVDDDPSLAKLTAEFLTEENSAFSTQIATSGSEALSRLQGAAVDAIVSDYDMPEMDGLELLNAVRAERPELPFILYTGRGSEEVASEAISAGVTDYLQKDTSSEQYELLANRITNAVAQIRARREYREGQARFQALTQNAPFAVVTIDEKSVVRYANDSIEEIVGFAPEEVVGDPLLKLMPERFHDAHLTSLQRYVQTNRRNLDWSWVELPGRHADGSEVPLGITFGELDYGGTHLFTAIIRDITEQKHVEAERELLHATIRAAAEAETFFDGLQAIVQKVCESFEWAYGEAWVPSSDGSFLNRTGAAYVTSEAFEPFKEVSRTTKFGVGEGLPGRTWERKEPVWMPNVSELTPNVFPRVEHAAKVGLKAALGVPIVADNEIVAILAFYMAEEKEQDERLIDTVTTVATELGELMERKRKTDALYEREQELERQRDELRRLNRLNTVIRNVVEATIEAETQAEIEERVCDRLAAEEPFLFAWIGEVDLQSNEVTVRAAADEHAAYLNEITITTDDDPTAEGPTGRAARTREVQVVQRIADDSEYEPWREQAQARGFRSSAAIPIVYKERLYGVLNVYANAPDVFDPPEQEVLSELGRAIAKAVSALEQKQALLGDRITELTLVSNEMAERFDAATGDEAAIQATFDRIVRTDTETHQFVSATGAAPESVVDALSNFPNITSVEVITERENGCQVKATMAGRTVAEVLADNGGRVRSAQYRDGDFRITAELPFGVDVRDVIEAVKSVSPDLELHSQRSVERSSLSVTEFQTDLEEKLTDQQLTAMELAYYYGFFNWPRDTTGEKIAETMDLSPATFHQHLRAGQRKLMETFLTWGESMSTDGE